MAQAASKTCEVCMSAPGSYYCIDCEEYYCESCKLLHNRQKLSRNHQFQKASDLIPEGKSKCSEHKEELTLLCNTCNVPVCTSCVTGNHNGHKFSKFVDAIAQLQGDNETKIRAKTSETNQNIKKIEDSLKSFDNAVDSVIQAITDESNKIKSLVDKSVAQMIVLVKTKSKKERDKLMNKLSDAKSVLAAGQTLDRRRQELDKTRQDGSLVQQINNLKKEIYKLHINSLPEFPIISFQQKSVTEDDIKQLIGTYTISKGSSKEEKQKQEHGDIYRCSYCGPDVLSKTAMTASGAEGMRKADAATQLSGNSNIESKQTDEGISTA
ncbi:E3 ubiquitin-protein ligase TRIM71-like [Mytilus trossulus]|uniref:E3 ubiquitin-protein ligase TRIM71-like n=1 Tax=Mytilus trossulus TaxID=6551 RepID=UPI0030056FD8